MSDDLNPKLRDEYRDLLMMRTLIGGKTMAGVAEQYGLSRRTASRRVRDMASEMMRRAMESTVGDMDHPGADKARFTVVEFTADPRAAMVILMHETIAKLEEQYPALKEAKK